MKMMRLTAAATFLLFLWGSTAAIANAQITVSLPHVSGSVGQTLDVQVTIGTLTAGDNVTSYEMDVTYDPSVVDIVGFDVSGMVADGFTNADNLDFNSNTIRIVGASASPVSGSGAFMTLEVEILAAGQSDLSFDRFVFLDDVGVEVPTTTSDGSVSVTGIPTVATNTGITVAEGQEETIGQANLETEDTDHNPSELTYTIDTAPSNGTVMRLGGGLAQGGTFTQTDVNSGILGYQHDGSETTTDDFDFTVEDPDGNTDTGTFDITVTPVNDPPSIGTNTGLTVDEGLSGTIGQAILEAEDADHGPAALTFTLDTPPSNGAIELSGTPIGSGDTFTQAEVNAGSVDYQHDDSETTSDDFDFTVRDDAGASATGTFDITISPINDAPVAQDDNATVGENESTEIDVLANDSDPEGDPLALSILSGPSDGAAMVDDNGSPGDLTDDFIEYTPDVDFTGTDQFTYEISDNNGGTDDATVSVTVVENQPPSASDDNADTDEDTATIIDVLANDDDPEGDEISVAQADDPTTEGGTTTINPDGTIQYEPSADFFGTDTFTYTIEDVVGGSDQATVTVTVNAVNDPPVIVQNSGLTVNEGAGVTIENTALAASDIDNPPADLTFDIDGAPANGTLLLNGTTLAGGDSFTQADVDADRLEYVHDDSETTSDQFTFTLSDGEADVSGTFDITITPINDAPVAQDDNVTVGENESADIDVLANDSDSEGDPLALSILSGPSDGAAVVDDNGSPGDLTDDFIEYTPDTDFTGTDQFTYEISDNNGGTDDATVSVTVVENQPPSASADNADTDEDTATIIDVLANDDDPEGDEISVVQADDPTTEGGTTTVNSNGTIEYGPPADFFGTDTFTYTIEDVVGGSDQATVTVTVNAVNDPPVIVQNSGLTVDEGAGATIENTALAASDIDNPPADLTFNIDDGPSNGSLLLSGTTLGGGDSFTQADVDANSLEYVHDGSETTSDQFTFTLSDGEANVSGSFDVTVNPVNDDPVAQDDDAKTLINTSVDIDVLANDSDAEGDPLTLSLVSGPANGTATADDNGTPGDPTDDFFTYTPDTDFLGSDQFTYEVSDGNGGTDQAAVDVTVTDNEPPVAEDDDAATDEDTPVDIDVLSNDDDPEGGPLTLTATDSPTTQGGVTAISGGEITYTPPTDFNGMDTFTYTVADDAGDSDQATVTVTVDPVNDPPVAADDQFVVNEDVPQNLDVLANDVDVDGDPLTLAIITQPTNGTAQPDNANDVITYSPSPDFNGTDQFAYEIEDPDGETDQATVHITVDPANDPPVFTSTPPTTATEGLPYSYTFSVSDVERDVVTVTAPTLPEWLSQEGSTISGTPGDDDVGENSVILQADDGNGGTGRQTFTIDVLGDADSDGIADVIEEGAPNDGDGNGDGAPDDQQQNVASLPSTTGDRYLTVVAEGGTDLVDVNTNAPTAEDPDAVHFPLGYVGFGLNGLEEGARTEVRILLETPAELNSYWKYGPTADVESPHWYEFVHDGTTGAQFTIDEATGLVGEFILHLADGGRGDHDRSVNGRIDDPGAPGAVPNAAPEAQDVRGLTNVDTPLEIDVLANDEDPDDDEINIVSVDDPDHGSASIKKDGTVRYTPDEGFFGMDSFNYVVEDVHKARAGAMVEVRVNALPVAVNDTVRVLPGSQVDIHVLANDMDPDGDELQVADLIDPLSGTAEGEFDTSGYFIRYIAADDFSGEDTFSYEVSDGFGGTDSGTVVILAISAPSAVDDEAVTDEDTDLAIDVLANDADPQGDALTVTDVQSPTAEGGTAEIDDEGAAVHYTPAPDFFGTDSFSYTIQSSAGQTAQGAITVTVNPVNDAPRFEETPVFTEPADGAEIRIGGMSSETSEGADTPFTVEWAAAVDPEGDDVQHTWQLAEGEDFEAIVVSEDVGGETQFEITYGAIADLLAQRGVELGSSITLHHRLRAADDDTVATSSASTFTLIRGTITSKEADEVPGSFELMQNYPNPFNPKSTIRYAIPEASFVELELYDLLGNQVRTLVTRQQGPGHYEVVVDAADIASGIYLYRLRAGSHVATRQLVVLK